MTYRDLFSSKDKTEKKKKKKKKNRKKCRLLHLRFNLNHHNQADHRSQCNGVIITFYVGVISQVKLLIVIDVYDRSFAWWGRSL